MNIKKDVIVTFEDGSKVYILDTMEYNGVTLAFVNELDKDSEPTDTYKVMLVNNSSLQKVSNAEILKDVFPMFVGTSIWPQKEEWKNKILFLETSEDEVSPDYVEYYLRNLIAQGIIDEINGILIGKPQNEIYYNEYKEVYKRLICEEAGRPDLPILYNVNIGHTDPICILPLGQKIKVDLNKKEIIFIGTPMSD